MSYSSEGIRSFIAIELPGVVKSRLARLRNELERAEHRFVKWVAPEALHLTLKFLGNIPFNQVAEITKAMEVAAEEIPPFALEISGLGAFPNLKQPRVFWIGIGGETDKLAKLQRNIDSVLTPFGFAKEERPFTPHLTLSRIKQEASPEVKRAFGELVMSTKFETKYPVAVDAISLMRSQLTPQGAIYTRLAIVELQE